ncbi:unnamed protein product [Camellia sinensis]
MSRFQSHRRIPIRDAQHQDDDDEANASETLANGDEDQGSTKLRPSDHNSTEDLEPFMGVKVRREASRHRDYRGDYIDVPSRPSLMKIIRKQGDDKVLFADKVLKFTASGKMKQRILIITDFAIYMVDPETDTLKRRIALAAVDKFCLSELSDNFLAIIIPTEYDMLLASTRKTQIVTLLVEANKSTSDYELEVVFSNRFEYNASADLVKEVQFEEVEVVLEQELCGNELLSKLLMFLNFKRCLNKNCAEMICLLALVDIKRVTLRSGFQP